MTVNQIMTDALLELDEDCSDLNEYRQKFQRYINDGYQIAVRDYLKPRRRETLRTDEKGMLSLAWMPVVRVIGVFDGDGREIPFEISAEGTEVKTGVKNRNVHLLYQTEYKALVEDLDSPQLPDFAHSALVDYVCYRHLSSGSMAKQAKAQYYLRNFNDMLFRLTPEAHGSVRNFRNLYESTGI